MDADELNHILEEYSTKRFYIEYGGYLSNHCADVAVALWRLNLPKEKIQDYLQYYVQKLESPEVVSGENEVALDLDLKHVKGERKYYYRILNHYMELSYGQSLSEIVNILFPSLALGLIGSAFHGLLHLGYGFSAKNAKIVLEGLAYIHHSYLPLIVDDESTLTAPLGAPGDLEIMDVLNLVRKDQDLQTFMLREENNYADRPELLKYKIEGPFSRRVAVLFTSKGDELVKYVNQIKLPDAHKLSEVDRLDSLLNWLINAIISVYVAAERNGLRNDFFILHGITSSWALKEVLPSVRCEKEQVRILRVYLCAILAAYMAQWSPTLILKYLNPQERSVSLAWKTIIDDATSTDKDEHIYKLIQVCKDMDSIHKNKHMSFLYKEATQVALKHPFYFEDSV